MCFRTPTPTSMCLPQACGASCESVRLRVDVAWVEQDENVTVLGLDSAQLRKARGAFFTPDVVAGYLAEWAVRSPADAVLEPSCGEAIFLLAVGRRLRQLGADGRLVGQLHGAELHVASAKRALALLNETDLEAEISVGDFLKADPHPRYDAVVGNPPYVRYQSFSGESRAAAKQAAMRAGVALTNLASSWAAFTVHSALHVKRGGRLGLVLPAEMLSVNYAAPVREFLMRQFKRVRLVLFTERVFPGVMEDVVLLLAEGCGLGPSSRAAVARRTERRDPAGGGAGGPFVRRGRPQARASRGGQLADALPCAR